MTTTDKALITRLLVPQNMGGEYYEHIYSPNRPASSEKTNLVARESENEEDFDSLPPGASLEQIKTWLDTQCKTEQARIDWTVDYDHKHQNHTEKYGVFDKRPNTAILDRIRRGHGPRSFKFEDLLWPLRTEKPERASRSGKWPRKESCKEMAEVLLKWNKHVSCTYEDVEAREALVHAMRGRIAFLDRALSHRKSADAHDDSSRKLLRAVHIYRPETIIFGTKDPFDLLIITLAHIGFAIPDIDHELKYLMFYILVTERSRMAHVVNAETRHKFEEKIADSKRRRDTERAAMYEQKMTDWNRDVFQKNCNTVAERVKVARRNIELKVSEELQTLTVLQIAQKVISRDMISKRTPPAKDLLSSSVSWAEQMDACSAAEVILEQIVREHMDDLDASAKVASQNNADMKEINRTRVLTRAMKFAGLDLNNVSETARRRVVEERMANPGTFIMMGNAIEGLVETKTKAKNMLAAVPEIDVRLEEMLDAAKATYCKYEELAWLVDSDSAFGVEGKLDGKFK
jgi:hypothetical protein